MKTLESFVIKNIITTTLTEDQQLVYKLENNNLVELPTDVIKNNLYIIIKSIFEDEKQKLKADTGLGYSVDATMNDLQLFEIGKELDLKFIKDADNVMHDANQDAYNTIIYSIKTRGMALMEAKWMQLGMVENFTTMDELKTYVNDILRNINW